MKNLGELFFGFLSERNLSAQDKDRYREMQMLGMTDDEEFDAFKASSNIARMAQKIGERGMWFDTEEAFISALTPVMDKLVAYHAEFPTMPHIDGKTGHRLFAKHFKYIGTDREPRRGGTYRPRARVTILGYNPKYRAFDLKFEYGPESTHFPDVPRIETVKV